MAINHSVNFYDETASEKLLGSPTSQVSSATDNACTTVDSAYLEGGLITFRLRLLTMQFSISTAISSSSSFEPENGQCVVILNHENSTRAPPTR